MFLPKGLILFPSFIVLTVSAAVKTPTGTAWTNFASKPGNINYIIYKIFLIFYSQILIHIYNVCIYLLYKIYF